MRYRQLLLAQLAALCTAVAAAQPPAYEEIPGWADFSGRRAPGSVSGVAVDDSRSLVWIAARCGANDCTDNRRDAPIIALDRSTGRPRLRFGEGLFVWPHGIHVDTDGNVWVADGRASGGRGLQVIKFAPDGKELMRIGEAGVAGGGKYQFSGPTGVAVAADGSIFVTDGHETASNHRVLKFTADGEFELSFGGFGSAPGEFNVPHAIAIDSSGRVFVADRDNNRIQIFDQDGRFLDQWTRFGRPSGIFIGDDDTIYVSDNQSNDARNPGVERGIRIGSARDGTPYAFIADPDFDPARDQETSAHGIAADRAGSIYGAEVWSETARKYRLVAVPSAYR